jgi:small subunit ribosomal protein S16
VAPKVENKSRKYLSLARSFLGTIVYFCAPIPADVFRPVSKQESKMAVRIRLARRGRKKAAIYDIVVANSKSPRDGRFIEKLGVYNPNTNPATIALNDENAFSWLMKGALPTDTTQRILSDKGLMFRKHLQVGVNKGAITQETADERLATWKAEKAAKVTAKVTGLATSKETAAKARLAQEAKAKEAKAEAIRLKKQVVEAPVAEAPEAEAPAEEA